MPHCQQTVRQTEPLLERFALVRFPLILLVVLIHADNREIWENGGQHIYVVTNHWQTIFQFYLSQVLSRSAVPLFFLISGYLFFYQFDGTWNELKQKWKNRIHTLIIPFLAWNGAAYLIVEMIQHRIPFSNGPMALLNGIIGITKPNYLFHFWFLRDLIILVCLVPLLNQLIRRMGLFFLLALAWFHLWNPLEFPWLSSEGILYFSLGAWLAVKRISQFSARSWIALIYLGFSILDVFLLQGWMHGAFHRLVIMMGVVAFVELAGYAQKWKPLLIRLSPASFFLYAFHEPWLRYCRYGVNWLAGPGFHLYCIPAMIVVPTGLFVYFRVLPHFPQIKKMLTGSR